MPQESLPNQSYLEARVCDMMDRLVIDLDLGWLKIHNKFDPRNSEERILCEATADWEYRQCVFLWNLQQLASVADDLLEDTAVHELVHALNAPIWSSLTTKQQNLYYKQNELATENVARVISHLLSKGTNGNS